MTISQVLPGVAVTDFDAAVAWYERFLGRPPDDRPMDGLAEWQVTADDRIQVVRDQERAGGALLTLAVDDLADHLADLAGRGIDAGHVSQTSGGAAFAAVSDPDGNAITLVEDPSAEAGSAPG